MITIDGKKIRDDILVEVKREVAELPFRPVFCDVLVGEDPASVQYVQIKKYMAETVGILFHQANFPATITTDELLEEIIKLNEIPNMCGIIIQLPLPGQIDRQAILDKIDPKLDVDCLGKVASEKFYHNYDAENDLGYPTALSCMTLLDSLNINLNKKNIVVLGQGMLVGRPVTALLQHRNLTPFIVTSKTENKEKFIKEADIIISGMGKGKNIKGDMIKKEVILIDAGAFEFEGSIVGDIDLDSVRNVAGYVSPVPGGVGPVTVAMLLKNVLKVAKKLKQNE